MSLADQAHRWFPTHVQATVLQAKGLQPKGKNGTNDAYTIIQLGKEKYCTSVAEKSLTPLWREEASFELPGLLLEGNPDVYQLTLIVMHRSLMGIDKFLGQTSINLNHMFDNKERRRTDWFKLESRPGKRSKDRGHIQVSIQFMRNNMTASMFDLSAPDKPRSPFSKLKEKVKGLRGDGLLSDSSSAILPRSPLCATDEPQQHTHTTKRPQLLPTTQKLSAAHSMSDLLQTDAASPHRRSHSDVPENFDSKPASIPHKYATLPRQHNPFECEQVERRDKVSLLERVTGRRDAHKHSASNPFSTEELLHTNPFTQDPHSSDKLNKLGNEDVIVKVCSEKEKHSSRNVEKQPEAYNSLCFEEVVQELLRQKDIVKRKDAHIRELEDYIDNLLVRVMEETPSILRNPYEPKRRAGKMPKK